MAVYRRHTKFGAEYITLFFDPTPTFTLHTTLVLRKINRNDLIYDCYLSYELPAIYTNNKIPFGWCDSVGTKIINETTIRFDGTQIERQTGDYMKVYNELITNETEKKYDELVGNDYLKNSGQQLSDDINDQEIATLAYKLYIPFHFGFVEIVVHLFH